MGLRHTVDSVQAAKDEADGGDGRRAPGCRRVPGACWVLFTQNIVDYTELPAIFFFHVYLGFFFSTSTYIAYAFFSSCMAFHCTDAPNLFN